MSTLSVKIGRYTATIELGIEPGLAYSNFKDYLGDQANQALIDSLTEALRADPDNTELADQLDAVRETLENSPVDPILEAFIVGSLGAAGPQINAYADEFCVPFSVMNSYVDTAVESLTKGGLIAAYGPDLLGRIEFYLVRDGYATEDSAPLCDDEVIGGCPIVNGEYVCTIYPVFLDLNQDGTITAAQRTLFDVFGDGFKYPVSWPAPQDGMLVFDLGANGSLGNGDSIINQAQELIFTNWLQGSTSDLQALADATDASGNKIFDTNSNGELDSSDQYFSSFKVWVDINENGISEAGELTSLAEAGISSISLSYNDATDCGCGSSDESSEITVIGSANAVVNGIEIAGLVADATIKISQVGYSLASTADTLTIRSSDNLSNYSIWFASLSGGADIAVQNGAQNVLVGDSRSNFLDGAVASQAMTVFFDIANDTVIGGSNDDLFVGTSNSSTGNFNILGGNGTDTVDVSSSVAAFTVDLLAISVESWRDGLGSSFINAAGLLTAYIYGNQGNDTIAGSGGADTLAGGADDDSISGAAGDDLMIGGDGADTITGGTGDDWINYTAGNDVIRGDAENRGQDTLDIRQFTLAQLSFSIVGTDILIGTPNGIVRLEKQILHELGYFRSNIETVLLADITLTEADIRARAVLGNVTEGNDTVQGTAYADVLYGLGGNDTLTGEAGNDTFSFQSGDDVILGNASNRGADTLNLGGFTLADARFTVSGTDIFITLPSGTIRLDSQIRYDLGNDRSNIETIVFADGTLTEAAIRARAILDQATSGNDTIQGTAYGDNAVGLDGNDSLIGSTGNDTLYGGDGADTLNGGGDTDSLLGGAGNDTYVIDAVTDVVAEANEEGIDLVQSAVNWTLGANVENLTLTSAAAVTGTGNELANTITGTAGNNSLSGLDGNDTLIGDGGNDTLLGGADHDLLDGGTGTDSLTGGAGNDTYVVNLATDVVVEAANEGIDVVQSGAAWTLGANFENLTLIGDASVAATGNAANNYITGNAGKNTLSGLDGNDTLLGAAGIDTLTGGNGADQFVFNNTQGGIDVITDFNELNGGGEEGDVLRFEGMGVGTFVYRGTGAFTGGSDNSEARISGNRVLVDTNGDGVADITITLTGLTTASQLNADDFIFV